MSRLGDIGHGTFWRKELKDDEELEFETEAKEELEEDLDRLEESEELEEDSFSFAVNFDTNELLSFSALIEAV